MSLNIKNQRVHDLAREAARRTGMSQTRVIEEALDEYVSQLGDYESATEERMARIRQILDEIDAIVTDEVRVAVRQSMDEMYDENGLPV